MRRTRARLSAMTGLWIALFLGQNLSAATPLWEMRAKEKQARTQGKAKSKTQAAQPEAPRIMSELDRVMGKDARALVQLFGQPVQDVREAAARKLQFATSDCVLDVYLYAPSNGPSDRPSGEKDAVVTYVAARVADGRDAERNGCITALRLKR